MGFMCSGPTTTNSPPQFALDNLQNAGNVAQAAASTPYQGYGGQLVAPLNQGQQNAIGQLQGMSGTAQPFLQSGANSLSQASQGLGAVQGYLQSGAQAGANAASPMSQADNAYGIAQSYTGQGEAGLGAAANFMNQAGNLATPQQFSGAALQQYMDPYNQAVVKSTMANMQENNAQQSQQLSSNAIGSGAYGGDRAGVAQAELARQQALADNQTIAGLNSANYSQALGQYNQNQAQRFQGSGLLDQAGQGLGQVAGQFGSLAGIANQTGQGYTGLGGLNLQQGQLYQGLGQLQGTTGQAQGQLAGMAGYLGNTAMQTGIAGASAGLQGSTLQQQTQQAKDAAAYQQFQNSLAYPFQTSSFLTNAATGVGGASGGTQTTTQSPIGAIAGLGTAGLGLGVLAHSAGMFSKGGSVGAGSDRSGFAKGGIAGLGGVNVMKPMGLGHIQAPLSVRHATRPHFADGGLSFTGMPYGATGLGAVANDPTAPNKAFGQIQQARADQASQLPGGNMHSMPGLGSPPAAGDPSGALGTGSLSGDGLGAASAASSAAAPTSGTQGFTPDPNNKAYGLIAAGLGMMGATGSGAQQIGQGGLAGLKFYTQLNQNDRSNYMANQELGIKKQNAAIEAQKLDIDLNRANSEAAYRTGVLANNASATQSENAKREVDTAAAGTQITPIGIRQYNPVTKQFDFKPFPTTPDASPSVAQSQPGLVVPQVPSAPSSPGASSAPAPIPPPSAQAPVPAPGPQASSAQPMVDDYGRVTGVASSPQVAQAAPQPTRPAMAVPPKADPTQAPDFRFPAQQWAQVQPDPSSPYAGITKPVSVPPMDAGRMAGGDYEKKIQDLSADDLKKAQEAAVSASSAKLSLAQMQNDFANIPSGGYGTQAAEDLAGKANSVLGKVGIGPIFDANAVAATEDAQKISKQLGMKVINSNFGGSREAASIINMGVSSVPSVENSPLGQQRLIASINAVNQRNIDYNTFAQNWSRATRGDTRGMLDAFNAQNKPEGYAARAVISTIPPAYVQRFLENKNNPAAAAQFDQRYGPGTARMVLDNVRTQ